MPYSVEYSLNAGDVDGGPAPTGVLAPGRAASTCQLPLGGGALQLRLRMGGRAWGPAVAEYAENSWRKVASRCALVDPHGRPAQVSLARVPLGCTRTVLGMQLYAPLWVVNRSEVSYFIMSSGGKLNVGRRSLGSARRCVSIWRSSLGSA